MGYKLSVENVNLALKELSKKYRIYAPKVFEGAGTFSDTDRVRYGEISTIEEIEFIVIMGVGINSRFNAEKDFLIYALFTC